MNEWDDAPDGAPPLPVEDRPRKPGTMAPVGAGARPPTPTWAEMQKGTNLGIWRITRVPVLVILGLLTVSHIALKGAWVFVDNFNLLLHEAGHVLFSWDGEALHILGGTLGQLLWPVLFAVYFWFWRRQLFATAAMVWWFGENLMNVARYMADAPFMELPLVGGGEHDWNTLLVRWHALDHAGGVASLTRGFGVLFMLSAYGLMVWLTLRPRQEEVDAPLPD